MEPECAVNDFLKRLHDMAARRGCHEMVAWAQLRNRPTLLDEKAVQPVQRLSSARALKGGAEEEDFVRSRCIACQEPLLKGGEELAFVPCGHAMHAACGEALVASYSAQGKLMPYACPCAPGCRGVIATSNEVATLISPSELPKAYAPCPGLNCTRFVLSMREGPHAVECGCGARFCHSCRGAPHPRAVPCGTLLAYEAHLERLQEALNTLDAVPLDALCAQMAVQHLPTTHLREFRVMPRWLALERLLSQELPREIVIGAPLRATDATIATQHLNDVLDTRQLVECARKELALDSDTRAAGPATTQTVLDEAVASLTLTAATHDSGVEQHSKFCPKCFARIVRMEGCPSMHCRCGHHFCYTCMGPVHTHDTCSRVVDADALRAAAELAGESAAVVDDLALFSDEAEHFAGSDQMRRWNLNTERDMRRQRIERLMPLSVATARLAALTEPGVSAPEGIVSHARIEVVLALEREAAITERVAPWILQEESGAALERLAASEDIRKYALLRVTIAKERVRRSLLPAETLAAMTWGAAATDRLNKAKAALSHLLPDEWLLLRCSQLVHETMFIDGVVFDVKPGEPDEDMLHIIRSGCEGSTTKISKRAVSVRMQPGQFSRPALARASQALAELVERVMCAGESAIKAFMHGPAGMRPKVTGAVEACPKPQEGDIVVRGPDWRFSVQDGTEGNHGAVVAYNSPPSGLPLRVKWLATGSENVYDYAGNSRHVVRVNGGAAEAAACLLRNAMRPLASKLRTGDVRALARIMVVLGRDSSLDQRDPKPDASVVRAIEAVCRTYVIEPQKPKQRQKLVHCDECATMHAVGMHRSPSPPSFSRDPAHVHASSVPGDVAIARLVRVMRMT